MLIYNYKLYSPGAVYIYKNMKKKNIYKIRLRRDFFLNLQQMGKVNRPFRWHQNFVPKGWSAPALGLYTYIKSLQNVYKIRLQRDFFKLVTTDWSNKMFLLTHFLSPCGLSAPAPDYIHLLNHEKMYIKSEVEVMRPFCWHQNFVPNGLSAPPPGL